MKNVLKKMFVAALLCLMQTAVCTADTFKGKIVNAETGEILIGATVRSEINPEPGWSMQTRRRPTARAASRSTPNGRDAS